MKKILIALCILILIIVGKSVFNYKKSSNRDLTSLQFDLNDPAKEDCPIRDKFLAAHPDATPEKMSEIELCNKERAASLGLDKPNTGFLGNTYSRPEGALAHYEGSGGRMFFLFLKITFSPTIPGLTLTASKFRFQRLNPLKKPGICPDY